MRSGQPEDKRWNGDSEAEQDGAEGAKHANQDGTISLLSQLRKYETVVMTGSAGCARPPRRSEWLRHA
jgi:hypothetical protein